MLVGIGTDIVEIDRVRALIERNADRFINRWFDEKEIMYCKGKAKPYLHFAARLAAKEAAFKALHLGGGKPLPWKDIIVDNNTDGSPFIRLNGEPRIEAERRGIRIVHLSISHCDSYAVASVVAEK